MSIKMDIWQQTRQQRGYLAKATSMLASLRVPALSSEEAVGTTRSTLMAHAVPLGPVSTLQEQKSAVKMIGQNMIGKCSKNVKARLLLFS